MWSEAKHHAKLHSGYGKVTLLADVFARTAASANDHDIWYGEGELGSLLSQGADRVHKTCKHGLGFLSHEDYSGESHEEDDEGEEQVKKGKDKAPAPPLPGPSFVPPPRRRDGPPPDDPLIDVEEEGKERPPEFPKIYAEPLTPQYAMLSMAMMMHVWWKNMPDRQLFR